MNEREILLDKLGAYMSTIGPITAVCLMLFEGFISDLCSIPSPLHLDLLLFLILSYILPYFTCTCMHNRKGIFYSSGSLGALIGAVIGGFIFMFLGPPVIGLAMHGLVTRQEQIMYGFTIALIFAPIPPLFTFLGARYMCKRAERKLSQKDGLNHRRS